jgi:hypothetical protein
MCPRLYKSTVWILGAITVIYLGGFIISIFNSKVSTTNMAVQFPDRYLWRLFLSAMWWLTMALVVRRLAIWIVLGDFTLVPKMGNAAVNIFAVSYFFLLLAFIAAVASVLFIVTASSDTAKMGAFFSVYAGPVLIGVLAAPGIFMLIPTFIWVEMFSVRNEGFMPNRSGQ